MVAGLFFLQAALLSIGITRDYRLKHEDNNAMHATFARSHLQLGLGVTRGHNYYYYPATRGGIVYPNHPPGAGLVLAAVYGVTGYDGPLATRATAVGFHLLAWCFFFGLARRVLVQPRELLLAMLLFTVLPESAFFGRMMNHEILVLPAALLLVRGYWEWLRGAWTPMRAGAVMIAASVWAALAGWAGFFVIGACGAHAAMELVVRRNRLALKPLALLAASGLLLFAADVGHALWILGGNGTYLVQLFAARSGLGAADGGLLDRIARILELHWRYFGLTSAAGLILVAWRAARGTQAAIPDAAVEVATVFLLAGVGYVAVFIANAPAHDYWQFLLLPASALGIVLLSRSVMALAPGTRLRSALIALVVLDIATATTVTLVRRHTGEEEFCIIKVAELRRDNL